jgi:hypothetical protein
MYSLAYKVPKRTTIAAGTLLCNPLAVSLDLQTLVNESLADLMPNGIGDSHDSIGNAFPKTLLPP